MKTGIISVLLFTLLGATGTGVSAQPGGPGAERFVLSGMVSWRGDEGVAWLQEPDLTRNELVALRIGQSVGPWKLTRFLENGVELDGPTGKILVPLQNVGAGGTAVAAGAPGRSGPAPATATVPRNDASRGTTPSAAVSSPPGFVGAANRPAPSGSALGEALNQARAARAQRQAENAQEQTRDAASPAGGHAGRGAGPRSSATSPASATPSTSATSSDGASAGGSGGTNQVIQLPVGGGKQGFRQLFGTR